MLTQVSGEIGIANEIGVRRDAGGEVGRPRHLEVIRPEGEGLAADE
jgi:hypothetical protein